jgi:hypothetical protein
MIGGRLKSALALFVARVLADDAGHPFPPDDAAGFTEALDGGTDLHEVGENKPATGDAGRGAGMSITIPPARKPEVEDFFRSLPPGGWDSRPAKAG